MTPYIRIPKLRNTIVALVAAVGLWVGAALVENPQVNGTHDALADGGQWGNKGGRGICG